MHKTFNTIRKKFKILVIVWAVSMLLLAFLGRLSVGTRYFPMTQLLLVLGFFIGVSGSLAYFIVTKYSKQ